MADAMAKTKSIIVEQEFPHPPEKIWRALTDPAIIERWLMANDFKPEFGHRFNFRSEPMYGWNGVTDSEVIELQPFERLAYTWNSSGEQARNGLKSVVTWTLTPTPSGTRVRMEHGGFREVEDELGYKAMGGGWPRVVMRLGEAAAALD